MSAIAPPTTHCGRTVSLHMARVSVWLFSVDWTDSLLLPFCLHLGGWSPDTILKVVLMKALMLSSAFYFQYRICPAKHWHITRGNDHRYETASCNRFRQRPTTINIWPKYLSHFYLVRNTLIGPKGLGLAFGILNNIYLFNSTKKIWTSDFPTKKINFLIIALSRARCWAA